MGHPAKIDVEGVSDTQAIVIPDPLTVNGLSAHRARAPKLVAGVAAWTSSDMFKTLVCNDLQKFIPIVD
jgi:aromatic amino acid aminotransferase I / 2-aminoadipate transaminase